MPTDNDYEQLIECFRADMGISDDFIPDMMRLLDRMVYAGRIKQVSIFPDGEHGKSDAHYDPKRKTIYVSETCAKQIRPKDRFTIGHEIAHVLDKATFTRHRNTDFSIGFGKKLRKEEVRANSIAAALLIPERLAAVDQETTIEEITARFGVSRSMASLRLSNLKRRHRQRHNIQRVLSESKPPKQFDTGDYALSFTEMMKNAEKPFIPFRQSVNIFYDPLAANDPLEHEFDKAMNGWLKKDAIKS